MTNENMDILSYFEGSSVTGGDVVHARAVAYQQEHGEKNYRTALAEVHKAARIAVAEADPMGPTMIVGEVAPPVVADVTTKPWEPQIRQPIPIIEIANLVFGLPKDEFGYVELSQLAEAVRPYRDIEQGALSAKMDALARTGISVLGLPNFSSENYAAGFRWAVQKYPDLARWYATGRMTAQAWRELLPQILIRD